LTGSSNIGRELNGISTVKFIFETGAYLKFEVTISFLVRTISNVLVMEIGWTDVGSGGIS
jgi:hypothetical protein